MDGDADAGRSFFARLTAGRGVAAGAAGGSRYRSGCRAAHAASVEQALRVAPSGARTHNWFGPWRRFGRCRGDAVYAQFLCLERQFVVDAFGADHHGVAVHRHDFRRGTGFDPQAGSRLAQIDGGALAFGDSRGERCQIVRQ